MKEPQADITRLLAALNAGDTGAMDRLLPLIYDELHRLAHWQRQRQHAHETLNTTALVHEAFLKLVRKDDASWQNRAHFFRIAARAMRDVLVDYARRQRAAKRGGDLPDSPLSDLDALPEVDTDEVLALHEALQRLEAVDPRQGQIVELRYFVGLTIPEAADVLGISAATVKRDWTAARAWLYREIRTKGA